jgi:hypothetical protein
MKTLGILAGILIVAVILVHMRKQTSSYTLPSGSISLMSLHEFSTLPKDMKDLYNEHVASYLFPALIKKIDFTASFSRDVGEPMIPSTQPPIVMAKPPQPPITNVAPMSGVGVPMMQRPPITKVAQPPRPPIIMAQPPRPPVTKVAQPRPMSGEVNKVSAYTPYYDDEYE